MATPELQLPTAPADAWHDGVAVWSAPLVVDSYLPTEPSAYPAYLHRRVYQGSSGRVYPLPFHERIAADKAPHAWQAVHLENEWLRVVVLPELGGRVHVVHDKQAGYDLFYRNNVVKPALVGLAGPWMSGGIEFNWPQHHRPATFLPTDVEIERGDDGSVTVWCSDHDPFTRMKGMHGLRLTPTSSRLEAHVRLYNRSQTPQTFLWWANVAAAVGDDYQSFFPADVTRVADHAKRAVVSFPVPDAPYYGVDYAAQAAAEGPEAGRLDWYRNIPVPTSYMALDTVEDFFGGYDHAAGAGFVHVAPHEISPGKKQWTWGNAPFGWAWDRNLTDADGPYVELMAGVYTDNQPDFAHLAAGETKTFTQAWYPIHGTGPVQFATSDLAVSLRTGEAGTEFWLCPAQALPAAVVTVTAAAEVLHRETVDLRPGRTVQVGVDRADASGLRFTVTHAGHDVAVWTVGSPTVPDVAPSTQRAAAPPPPAEVGSIDELVHIATYLDQYRHATRSSVPYLEEVLARDPGESRALAALGAKAHERGEHEAAVDLLSRSAAAATRWTSTPASGEAHYRLGLALVFLGRDGEAATVLARASWDARFATSARFALARLRSRDGDVTRAVRTLREALDLDPHHLQSADLLAALLLETGRHQEAQEVLAATLRRDPLDAWARHLAGLDPTHDATTMLDVALEYAAAGLSARAVDALTHSQSLLERTAVGQVDVGPLLDLHRAVLADRAGDGRGAREWVERAAARPTTTAYASRLEDVEALLAATRIAPDVALPPALLGHWYYAHGRPVDAVASWRAALDAAPGDDLAAVLHRNLGLAAFNDSADPAAAEAEYDLALAARPEDARLWFERDQLALRTGTPAARRLKPLEAHRRLVLERDDLTVTFAGLLIDVGRAEEARELLATRAFQPWEGGEGQVLGVWERACLAVAGGLLADGEALGAVQVLEEALEPPENLGENRHPLATTAQLRLTLGDALAALGKPDAATAQWEQAATSTGDFVDMAQTAYNRATIHAADALTRLGRSDEAVELVDHLQSWLDGYAESEVEVDFFATSLPSLLLFVEHPAAARDREVAHIRQQIQTFREAANDR
ncbi:DUF5107 domain-containing protein [Kineococcus sp. TBRC 1896]|uniref:DUF5107 domain-containing protein n=1 Tax=Kineococcus mangrovi TaxID=1660183 RepID=A0ABV4HYH1_9ACTN